MHCLKHLRITRSAAAPAVIFCVLSTLPAANANVVGTDAQNFNPTTSGLDFVTVHSSETLLPGVFNIGIYLNEAWDALPRFSGSPDYDDRLLGMDFNIGVGLAERWDAGISLPSVLSQSITSQSGFNGRYSATGLTELKLNTKYRFSGELDGGFALIASTNLNLIRNNPYTGIDSGPTITLEAAYDRTYRAVAAGMNVGHRWRKPGAAIQGIPINPFGNQWIASLAGSYLISKWDSKVVAEVFGSVPASASGSDTDREQSSLEFLLGLKHDFSHNLAGHVGMGRELISGLSSPNFRVYAGLNYQLGPLVGSTANSVRMAATELPEPKEETLVLRRITFEFDSTTLTHEARTVLNEVADHLNKTPFKRMVIEGHTDSIGNEAYNLALSDARANAIRDELIKAHGFDAMKLEAVGYGESRPIANNGNYQGRELNRRVELRISR